MHHALPKCVHLPYLRDVSLMTKTYGLLQLIIMCTFIYNCIPDAKRGYYGFIIVVVRGLVRALVRVRRDFLLATYNPHFFPDFFHIWLVA